MLWISRVRQGWVISLSQINKQAFALTDHADTANATGLARCRLDKWLWAARFYKTRALAVEAINLGRILVNQERSKPARMLKRGDSLTQFQGPYEKTVFVEAVSDQRGSATEAQKLYTETPASIEQRATVKALLAADRLSKPRYLGRPDKRDRRRLVDLKHSQSDNK